jgi:hypothetical protein
MCCVPCAARSGIARRGRFPHPGKVVAGRARWMAVLLRRELLISGGTATGLVIADHDVAPGHLATDTLTR